MTNVVENVYKTLTRKYKQKFIMNIGICYQKANDANLYLALLKTL